MNNSRVPLLLGVVFIAACANVDRDEGRFVINDRTLAKLSPGKVTDIRSAWAASSANVAQGSKLNALDMRWSLDFIANIEAGGVSPCATLELKAVRPLELVPLNGKNIRGEAIHFKPRSYHEAWDVLACGKPREWRVLDEESDPRNPHRVLLWKAG